MNAFYPVLKRELNSYFNTPLAYVFLVIFLALTAAFAFYLGSFYERDQADLVPFFTYHPWLYLVLIPAISMRLWSEERKSGNIELIMTLPVSQWTWVLAKFLAAWIFTAIALVLTFPMWASVSYLGDPDQGVIIVSYIGSWLLAGAYLAIGSCMSALNKNQVIAFILTVVICFLFSLAGLPLVLEFFQAWGPQWLVDTIAGISVFGHYNSVVKGVLSLQDLLYFISLIAVWLIATTLVIDQKKAD